MQPVQNIVPISDFRNNQDEVLQMMDAKGPVILAQRSTPRAVLVSVEQWNEIAKQLEERQFTKAHMDALALFYEQDRISEDDWVDGAELTAMMAERNGHVADKV